MSDVPHRPFRIAFRGYDPAEVDRRLTELEVELEKAREERDRLAARLEQLGEKHHDFDTLGAEIGQILSLAQDAADGMRTRAKDEVALWRAEARAEVDHAIRSATSDAEAMRGDAWQAAEQLIGDAQRESTRLVDEAEREAARLLAEAQREALAVTGQAERDAHRMGSAAKRDAEEQVRLAKVEAERILAEARAERDQIVETARKAADQAQERARALEVRRNDLLSELEAVRSTVARLESDLEEKRQHLGDRTGGAELLASEAPSSDSAADESTAEVPASQRGEEAQTAPVPLAEPVEERTNWASDSIRIIPASKKKPEPEPEPEPPEPETPEPEPAVDDVADLFESLRDGGSTSGPRPGTTAVGIDAFALRDQLLLPITNRILRSVKRQLTDSQNQALEELKEQEDKWKPSVADVGRALKGDFVILAQESFAAGYAGVEAMTGETLGRAKPEAGDVDEQTGAFTAALEEALVEAVGAAETKRARSSAVSKTYRVWRTDEAERRIRSYARLGYHRGVVRGLYALGLADMTWMAGSATCDECLAEAAKSPLDIGTHLRKGMPVPPLHAECSCTLTAS